MLIATNLLKPLGKPARNCIKYFAKETLAQLRRDEMWLARDSDAIAAYWRHRNARKRPLAGATYAEGKVLADRLSKAGNPLSLGIDRRKWNDLIRCRLFLAAPETEV